MPLVEVWAFGSRVRGDFDGESNLDVVPRDRSRAIEAHINQIPRELGYEAGYVPHSAPFLRASGIFRTGTGIGPGAVGSGGMHLRVSIGRQWNAEQIEDMAGSRRGLDDADRLAVLHHDVGVDLAEMLQYDLAGGSRRAAVVVGTIAGRGRRGRGGHVAASRRRRRKP